MVAGAMLKWKYLDDNAQCQITKSKSKLFPSVNQEVKENYNWHLKPNASYGDFCLHCR